MTTEEALKKAAMLSRIHLSDEDKETLLGQISKILAHFEELAQVATDGVDPLVTPSEMENLWRSDKSKELVPSEELISLAPEVQGKQIKVPQVV